MTPLESFANDPYMSTAGQWNTGTPPPRSLPLLLLLLPSPSFSIRTGLTMTKPRSFNEIAQLLANADDETASFATCDPSGRSKAVYAHTLSRRRCDAVRDTPASSMPSARGLPLTLPICDPHPRKDDVHGHRRCEFPDDVSPCFLSTVATQPRDCLAGATRRVRSREGRPAPRQQSTLPYCFTVLTACMGLLQTKNGFRVRPLQKTYRHREDTGAGSGTNQSCSGVSV